MKTPVKTDALVFWNYSKAERAADRVVHIIGVPAGLIAAIVIVVRIMAHGSLIAKTAVAIYAFGLAGMLTASAAYQLAHPGMAKERLRRLDRAMIFVMIAGTYTPISATVLYGRFGVWLCAILWSLAAIGIFLTLRYPRRFERLTFGLYLAMGWMLVILVHDCFQILPPFTMGLILAGGIAYTLGAIIQSFPKIKFHNPVWHALVLIAASLQYAAIFVQMTGPGR